MRRTRRAGTWRRACSRAAALSLLLLLGVASSGPANPSGAAVLVDAFGASAEADADTNGGASAPASSPPLARRASAALPQPRLRPADCSDACRGGACLFSRCEAAPAASCRGGGCRFESSVAPSCDGGGCSFVDCARPTCRGGGCDFSQHRDILLGGFCDGGGCSFDGEPVQSHLGEGGPVY